MNNRDLYLKQKRLLDTFLEHGAIDRAQYDKSLGDLKAKMKIEEPEEPTSPNGPERRFCGIAEEQKEHPA